MVLLLTVQFLFTKKKKLWQSFRVLFLLEKLNRHRLFMFAQQAQCTTTVSRLMFELDTGLKWCASCVRAASWFMPVSPCFSPTNAPRHRLVYQLMKASVCAISNTSASRAANSFLLPSLSPITCHAVRYLCARGDGFTEMFCLPVRINSPPVLLEMPSEINH